MASSVQADYGRAMPLRYRISSLTSKNGDTTQIPTTGVTCIVGGNNAGKSQLLRDIYQYMLQVEAKNLVVLADLEVERAGEGADFAAWLEKNAAPNTVAPGSAPTYSCMYGGSSLGLGDFVAHWGIHPKKLIATTPYFCWYATAGSLASVATGGVGQGFLGPVLHPLTRLLQYGELEEQLSALAMEAFELPLVLDRLSSEIRLRVGDPGVAVPPLNRPTREYADAVAALPTLDHQGDGMKAFMGLAVNVIAGTNQVLLIDEPEAFLHPAQARALGRWLATEARQRDKQIILATHDRDLVLGLLDANAPVKMIRVNRIGNENTLRELTDTHLSNVWSDPVLKYSNVLQGLFHERVVVCEADADCRFYSAVLDTEATEANVRALADSTLFVPAGGKQRMPTLAHALSSLGVQVFALPDFDVLRDKRDVKRLLEGLGGTWTPKMDELYLVFVRSVKDPAAWEALKNQGLAGLKKGAVFISATKLLTLLADSRLIVVPVGEMEDFNKAIDLHSSAWVTAMLEADGHRTCTAARELVAPLTRRS